MRNVRLLATLGAFLVISVHLASDPIGSKPAFGAQAVPETGTVVAGEFRLRYRVEGTGIPTIVIGSSVYLPRAFSQNVRKHLRMVFMDHRGYAPSPGPMDAGAFAEDKILGDVERARQQLGLNRVVIIGHSIHGVMALEYAKTYPDNVSHVVMIGSPSLRPGNALLVEQYWDEFGWPESARNLWPGR